MSKAFVDKSIVSARCDSSQRSTTSRPATGCWLGGGDPPEPPERTGPGAPPLVIATTRPELLPACVALYRHPADPRYAALADAQATVPLFGYRVPVLGGHPRR
jgi:hypothetical protein